MYSIFFEKSSILFGRVKNMDKNIGLCYAVQHKQILKINNYEVRKNDCRAARHDYAEFLLAEAL